MNNKGQALVEFIIILPIFIMIILVVFDYARIIQTKKWKKSWFKSSIWFSPNAKDRKIIQRKKGQIEK